MNAGGGKPGKPLAETLDEVIARHLADAAASGELATAASYGKPFVDDELATKVRNALAEGTRGNVVRLRR